MSELDEVKEEIKALKEEIKQAKDQGRSEAYIISLNSNLAALNNRATVFLKTENILLEQEKSKSEGKIILYFDLV
jgi:hypothetical protein